jgi:polyphosphate kinase 2
MATMAKSATRLLRKFDLDNPKLPAEIEKAALGSGGFPYDERLKRKPYEEELGRLQSELLKLQDHVAAKGVRIVSVFEGRDAAGKGGTIARFLEHMNARHARSVALNKPNEVERGQWYFQRYIVQFPTAGEIVFFDRSWYNRAGVERVMGFCSEEEVANFLRDAPELEELLVRGGLKLFKFYLTLGREMQLKRFHERRHDPLKRWKLSPVDIAAIEKWDDYSRAQADMFRYTHTASCPWMVVRANDQRRARLEAIRTMLSAFDYEGKDTDIVGKPDPLIVGSGPDFLTT